MSTDTPIYREAITEAKRRTKRHSPERRILTLMDEQTAPKKIAPSLAERQTIGIYGQKAQSHFPKRSTRVASTTTTEEN